MTLRVSWPATPDLALVEALAQLTMRVRRLGGDVAFGPVPRELIELFRLAALLDVLTSAGG